MRIFYACPDTQQPIGGVKVIYKHIELLQKAGFEAFVLHSIKGFACNWFETKAKISYLQDVTFTANDYLVLPENTVINQLHKPLTNIEKRFRKLFNKYKYKHFSLDCWKFPCRKILFNQNAYYSFDNWPSVDEQMKRKLYGSLNAIMCVSEDNKEYLMKAFPNTPINIIPPSIEYYDTYSKQNKLFKIAYMPRKNANHIQLVQAITKLPENWGWEPINNVSAKDAVKKIAECKIFAAFGHPEGLQLPPLEAMAHNTLVVGYHGEGCRQFMNEELAFPIPFGGFQDYANTLETITQTINSNPNSFNEKIAKAQHAVKSFHSTDAEINALVNFWKNKLNS